MIIHVMPKICEQYNDYKLTIIDIDVDTLNQVNDHKIQFFYCKNVAEEEKFVYYYFL